MSDEAELTFTPLTRIHGLEFDVALVAALGELTEVPRGHEAEVETRSGSKYKYTYADLGAVLSHVRPVLARHGLAITQEPDETTRAEMIRYLTHVHHASETRSWNGPYVPIAGGAQDRGSAMTYARRYSVLGALGLATEDDDGGRAQRAPSTPASSTPPPRNADEAVCREILKGLPQGDRLHAIAETYDRFGATLPSVDEARLGEVREWLEGYRDDVAARLEAARVHELEEAGEAERAEHALELDEPYP